MSVRTPIFTTPSEILSAARPAAGRNSAAIIIRPDASRFMGDLVLGCWLLDAQVALQLVHALLERVAREGVDDAPVLHDVVAVGQLRGDPEVLLHQDHREPLLL